MKTIPEIRTRMHEIADQLGAHPLAAELHALAEATRRKFSGRVAPRKSARMTGELALRIVKYAVDHPDASLHEIATVFDVNTGRVSEALTGKREDK